MFHAQGEGVGEELRMREQIRKTERDLRAQMDENEKRHMRDKHIGEKRHTQVHTFASIPNEFTSFTLQPLYITHMLHAFLHKQSYTPMHSPYYQVTVMDAYP